MILSHQNRAEEDGLVTSQKARRAKFEAVRGPDRGCSPPQTAYNCAVGWEKRKRVIEPGTSAAWRSFSETAATPTTNPSI